jgi:hypothetical protein
MRTLLAAIGLAILSCMSFGFYVVGYQIGYTGSGAMPQNIAAWLVALFILLLTLIGIGLIVKGRRRRWRDAIWWSLMPASLLAIGFTVEVARYGF